MDNEAIATIIKIIMFNKIPLAWLQVTREKTRLAVAIAGIAFADLLIFIQMGFESVLCDSCFLASHCQNLFSYYFIYRHYRQAITWSCYPEFFRAKFLL